MSFDLPPMYENPNGWGPPRFEDNLPFDIPYQPFNKGDRISRIADWVPPDTMRGRGRGGRYVPTFLREEPEGENGEEKWTTADYHKTATRPRRGRGRGRGGFMGRGGQQRRPQTGGGPRASAIPKSKKKPDLRDPGFRRKDVHRTASIEVKQSWTAKTSIQLTDLKRYAEIQKSDNQGVQVPAEEVLATNGDALQFNPNLEKATPRDPVKVMSLNRAPEFCDVMDSTIMKTMCKEMARQGGVQIYATEEVLATLMCARQSINSWDISIERFNDIYFFNWRKGTGVDQYTVNETSQDPPIHEEPPNATEEQKINTQPKLMRELTNITNDVSQQMFVQKPVEKARSVQPAQMSDEFEESGKTAAKVIYRYKKWTLKQPQEAKDFTIVARTHVDGYSDNSKSTLRTFAYFDPQGKQWQQRLPGSEGAVTAAEIKNNCCRVAKQVCMTLLSGADHMRMAFVTRKRADNPNQHQIVHVTKVQNPNTFCVTISQSYRGMWNVLNKILQDIVKAKDPSKTHQRFVLLKEPNKGSLTLYDTNADQDDSSDDDDDDDEEEEEEEESEE